jgi:urea transport system permease protein
MKIFNNHAKRLLLVFCLLLTVLAVNGRAESQEYDAAVNGLASSSRSTILKSIDTLGDLGTAETLPMLEALMDRRLYRDENGLAVMVSADGKRVVYAVSGEPANLDPQTLDSPTINNRVRRTLKPLMASLQLFSPSVDKRREAAQELAKNPRPDDTRKIQKALDAETDSVAKDALALALALIEFQSPDEAVRINAIRVLGDSGNPSFIPMLDSLLAKDEQGVFLENKDVTHAAITARSAIKLHMTLVGTFQDLYYGMSLGSVLLLAAMGLAITFGLMGVINMAHGEMLMLGAYTTFVAQNLFNSWLPGFADYYILAAVPMAFCVSCFVGIVLERAIIRHLYGRPLETLLATWGISLLLIQSVRLIFGAQNVEVANPSWFTGGWEPTTGLMFTYNRLAILLFVVIVVALVWLILTKTSLGLKVRCVTQNRDMAASMGINTAMIDMWTFGFGSGIAGLGGVALSQIGNVGPELGQSYIVDSFMVVVLGGVGKLAGTVFGAMGLGVINKFLEPHMGAVLGKIMILALIILVIQKRPQGLFAPRGRAA